jgi:hypothetical protein
MPTYRSRIGTPECISGLLVNESRHSQGHRWIEARLGIPICGNVYVSLDLGRLP